MTTLSSNNTFTVTPASTAVVSTTLPILPVAPAPTGSGRLVHPLLGAYDYEVKPEEWVNVDADILIPPIWAITKTLGGSVAALWQSFQDDVVVEERWGKLSELVMPANQIRMLAAFWSNPVDPATGQYVQWFPSYANNHGYNVLIVGLTAGGAGSNNPLLPRNGFGQGIVLDDVINYLDAQGNNIGWVDNPVVLTMKIVNKFQ